MDKRSLLQPKGMPIGIYFDLPNEMYHDDPALSHSGIVHMLNHHYDYWVNSPLNPKRKRKEPTDAMKLGTQSHMLLLQPDLFKKTYWTKYDKYDSKREFIGTNYEAIKEAIRLLEPIKKKYIVDGYPEVSIIWIDGATGVRCRARIDYLRTFGGIDYKRCKDVQLSKLGWHVNERGYDLQDVFYRAGIREIKRMLREKIPMKISGEYDRKWLEAFRDDDDVEFKFIFQRSTPPFVYDNIDFDQEVCQNAEIAVNDAKERYMFCIENYGTEEEWPAGENQTTTMTLYHMPRRILDRGARPL